jgi:Transglycosylase SLT domain
MALNSGRSSRTNPRMVSRRTVLCAALALSFSAIVNAGPAAEATQAPSPLVVTDPATVFGQSYQSSTDLEVTGAGDTEGFHVLAARESSGFTWQNLATLGQPGDDSGPWTGQLCVTGDRRYAIVVYGPDSLVNQPEGEEAGANAAVVDLSTGATTEVADGVSLAYFSPSCGSGDEALLTRSLGSDDAVTQLIRVNAKTAEVISTTSVDNEVTTPVIGPAGAVYGMVGGWLSSIDAHGAVTHLAKPDGRPYTVTATADGSIDLATTVGTKAEIQRWSGGRVSTLGTGPLNDLDLFGLAGGTDLVTGAVSGIDTHAAPDIRTLNSSSRVLSVSQQGDFAVTQVLPLETRDRTVGGGTALQESADTGRIQIGGFATGSGTRISGMLDTAGSPTLAPASKEGGSGGQASTTQSSASTMLGDGTSQGGVPRNSVIKPASTTVPPPKNPAAANDQEMSVNLQSAAGLPASVANPTCLVGRNNVNGQVLQPSASVVEWAVDQAVHGDLMTARPANYLATGEPSYTPQVMFPPVALSTGGTIPAQVLLGIFAQESNFKQASWHAAVGDGGNPLISDYYGTTTVDANGKVVVPADDPDYLPDYAQTDCGYGLGQVTDEMSALDSPQYSQAQAVAVATDFEANIAASAQILAETWNDLAATNPPMLLNGGDPAYIENWYLAIWAYNSGFYPQADASSNDGHYGVGWLNNPANPRYPSNLVTNGFQPQTVPTDANTPQDWPYQELVIGWINQPQETGTSDDYATPTWGPDQTALTRPTLTQFCSPSVNACDPSQSANPCPSDSSSCWWDQPTTWITNLGVPGEPPQSAATENLTYAVGSAQPILVPIHPNDCGTGATNFYKENPSGTLLVTDLANPSENTRGCTWTGPGNGKFTIRLGDNVGMSENSSGVIQANPLTAQIDLHQIGGGYLGHFYFTHTYDGTQVPSTQTLSSYPGTAGGTWQQTVDVPKQIEHEVTGTWTPAIPAGSNPTVYDIWVAIPVHGAGAVTYTVDPGGQLPGSPETCTASQDNESNEDEWEDLGDYSLSPGADLQLNNMVPGAEGTDDIAFSAAVFIPDPGHADSPCNDNIIYDEP